MLTIQGLEGRSPLEEYRLRTAHKPEIIEQEISPGLVCFSVMKGVGSSETYDDWWTREARGITFSAHSGNVLSRPLHKFFNIGERETTQAHKLDWSKVTRVMDKRDGSMIHPVFVDQSTIKFKSKKVLDSEVAVEAEKYALANEKYMDFCFSVLAIHNATPIFEWTSPGQRIVLGYGEPELKLLHIRNNDDGYYWPLDDLREASEWFGIPLVDEVTEFNSFEEMLAAAETREEIEGWVIQFEDGEMVKVKTDWYMARHRAFTFFRERDIVKLIMDEQIDDVKAMFVKDGINIDVIEEIERRFALDMQYIIVKTERIHDENKHLPAKDVAAKFKGDLYFGLIMAKYNKKEPQYLKFFEANLLKQNYGLNSLRDLQKPEGTEEE